MGVQITKPGIDLGIVTANGEAMLAFYRDVLGLAFKASIPMPVGDGTMHRLQCGDTLIKLVAVPSLPAQAAPGGIQGASGYRYFTITVSNLAEMVATCAAAGHKVAMTPREIRPGVSIAMVEDPDGNWVEFLQVG